MQASKSKTCFLAYTNVKSKLIKDKIFVLLTKFFPVPCRQNYVTAITKKRYLTFSLHPLQRQGPHRAREGVAADVHHVRRRPAPGTRAYSVRRQRGGKKSLVKKEQLLKKLVVNF